MSRLQLTPKALTPTGFRFHWSKQNGSTPELNAQLQFIAMIDEGGERFADHKYCERYQYRVGGSRLSLLGESVELERCFPEEPAP